MGLIVHNHKNGHYAGYTWTLNNDLLLDLNYLLIVAV